MNVSDTFALLLLGTFLGIGITSFIAAWHHDHPQDPIAMRRLREKRRLQRRRYTRFWGL